MVSYLVFRAELVVICGDSTLNQYNSAHGKITGDPVHVDILQRGGLNVMECAAELVYWGNS